MLLHFRWSSEGRQIDRLSRIFEVLSRNQLLAWLGVSPFLVYLGFAVFGGEIAKVFIVVGPLLAFVLSSLVANWLALLLNRYVFKGDEFWKRRMAIGLWILLYFVSFPPLFGFLNVNFGTEVELHPFGDYVLFGTILGFAGFYFSSGKAEE